MPHADEADTWASDEPAYPGRDALATALGADVPSSRAPGNNWPPDGAPAPQPPAHAGELSPLATTGSAPEVIDLIALPQLVACLTPWRTSEQDARARVQSLPLPTLQHLLASPALQDGLPRLVPLLKVSHVVPCLQAPELTALVWPHLAAAQCKLLGPELAALIAPHLHLHWDQLEHLPLETVVLLPADTLCLVPLAVLRRLPILHRDYLAPFVKGARKVNHDLHELALCEGLSEILHLHTHKVLDPEHIPEPLALRALQRTTSLRATIQQLRWLVDAVMSPAVEAIQVSSLKLTTLALALRKAGLAGVANELELSPGDPRQARTRLHGAGGVAYTRDQVIAVHHARIDDAGALAGALADAFHRHTGLARPGRGKHADQPLPTARHVPIISVELAAAHPPDTTTERHELEAVIYAQLGEPRHGIAIHEVQLRWADGSILIYRRRSDGLYL
jgi:hypothetical protein